MQAKNFNGNLFSMSHLIIAKLKKLWMTEQILKFCDLIPQTEENFTVNMKGFVLKIFFILIFNLNDETYKVSCRTQQDAVSEIS